MTVTELKEKYGEPRKFKDYWGITNYAVPREVGIEDAMKLVCSISKEPQYKMCACFAKDEGDQWRFRAKNSDHIVISKLRIEKNEE